jgi:hypothetical protein
MLHVPTPPVSSRLGIIAPMEGRRWSVSLCANQGDAPPGDIEGFMAFAKSLRTPTIYNAIRSTKRVGDIARFGMPCSVRRAFDKLDRFPRGLVPLGGCGANAGDRRKKALGSLTRITRQALHSKSQARFCF